MEQCLDLARLGEPERTFELVLYYPWMCFLALWLLSFIHYDRAIFLASTVTNYIFYGLLNVAASGVGWRSPMAKPCESFLYSIFTYQWPCPSFVVWLASGILLITYHYRRRRAWWSYFDDNRWTWRWASLLLITIFLPPLIYVAFLVITGIQSLVAVLLNIGTAVALVLVLLLAIPNYKVADALIDSAYKRWWADDTLLANGND
jgi:hypothetical protein